jgi:hypothetical protein
LDNKPSLGAVPSPWRLTCCITCGSINTQHCSLLLLSWLPGWCGALFWPTGHACKTSRCRLTHCAQHSTAQRSTAQHRQAGRHAAQTSGQTDRQVDDNMSKRCSADSLQAGHSTGWYVSPGAVLQDSRMGVVRLTGVHMPDQLQNLFLSGGQQTPWHL